MKESNDNHEALKSDGWLTPDDVIELFRQIEINFSIMEFNLKDSEPKIKRKYGINVDKFNEIKKEWVPCKNKSQRN